MHFIFGIRIHDRRKKSQRNLHKNAGSREEYGTEKIVHGIEILPGLVTTPFPGQPGGHTDWWRN
jgi:hypothetical protein